MTAQASKAPARKAKPAAKAAAKSVAKPAAQAAVKTAAKRASAKKSAAAQPAAKVKLLSGGNPQIAKGYGEAPVQAFIDAVPGWKSEVARKIDALITRAVPGVKKAVKWNSPFYGVEEGIWFMGFHYFDKYVKVSFFRGAELKPEPPGPSKQKLVRYLDIRESDVLDEKQFMDWVKQASRLPGEKM